jgi:hypothetical protein
VHVSAAPPCRCLSRAVPDAGLGAPPGGRAPGSPAPTSPGHRRAGPRAEPPAPGPPGVAASLVAAAGALLLGPGTFHCLEEVAPMNLQVERPARRHPQDRLVAWPDPGPPPQRERTGCACPRRSPPRRDRRSTARCPPEPRSHPGPGRRARRHHPEDGSHYEVARYTPTAAMLDRLAEALELAGDQRSELHDQLAELAVEVNTLRVIHRRGGGERSIQADIGAQGAGVPRSGRPRRSGTTRG